LAARFFLLIPRTSVLDGLFNLSPNVTRRCPRWTGSTLVRFDTSPYPLSLSSSALASENSCFFAGFACPFSWTSASSTLSLRFPPTLFPPFVPVSEPGRHLALGFCLRVPFDLGSLFSRPISFQPSFYSLSPFFGSIRFFPLHRTPPLVIPTRLFCECFASRFPLGSCPPSAFLFLFFPPFSKCPNPWSTRPRRPTSFGFCRRPCSLLASSSPPFQRTTIPLVG